MLHRLAFIAGILAATLAAGLLLLPMTSGERALAQAGATPPALATAAPAGQDTIWSGVVIATNVASPKPPPPELREFAGRLKRVFGYNQFELFGSASKPIGNRTENWLVPSQNFWLSVHARRAMAKEARGGYLLNLELFQDRRPLVDTEAKLAPGSPLFIRGPMYGNGQVIIVLQVQGAMVVAGQ
jgi:hypothetical protein